MKTSVILFIFLTFNFSNAGVFLEPLLGTEQIFRGRAPKASEMKTLVDAGITSVLIFKNQLKTEVDEEINQLISVGINKRKIHHIPFLWKDITSEKLACEQVVEALTILQKVQTSVNDKILFHCTVGEDRTGLLAGLMSQLLKQEDIESSFINQMWSKGYTGGNKTKPHNVSLAVDKYLTPLYYKISQLISDCQLTADSLNKNVCKKISTINVENIIKTCDQL